MSILKMFWMQVAKELLWVEKRLVGRARIDLWKFECLGRILSHTVALTGRFPINACQNCCHHVTSDLWVDDECVLDDVFPERDLLTKPVSDLSGLTDEDYLVTLTLRSSPRSRSRS